MDNQNYTTIASERRKGQHLRAADRGQIKAFLKLGMSIRAIARELDCSPSTVSNELKRGTPPRTGTRGRVPGYSPQRGEAVYRDNRKNCHRPLKIHSCSVFVEWVARQFRTEKWSFDACYGYAKTNGLFRPDEMVCTKTLYSMAWRGELPISILDCSEAVKRKPKQHQQPKRKKKYGKGIEDRPEKIGQLIEEGHWEGDTVVGKREGKESVVFTLLEKVTRMYIAIRIPGKTAQAVLEAMTKLRSQYGEHFTKVFKSITVDNGSEFSRFAELEEWGTSIYYGRPYTSTDRAQNERHNGLFRAFVPKGRSIERYSDEYIRESADCLNRRPRRTLGYATPEEKFKQFLKSIYAA